MPTIATDRPSEKLHLLVESANFSRATYSIVFINQSQFNILLLDCRRNPIVLKESFGFT
ncbi:hypothetical protein ACSLVK_06215 [Photorhabdus tasmaniensis]|uniref:hypothetical protein n=1 Tax=Photorhabdus tasmaniensis TaxID=1004159 RepID=UPI0040427D23